MVTRTTSTQISTCFYTQVTRQSAVISGVGYTNSLDLSAVVMQIHRPTATSTPSIYEEEEEEEEEEEMVKE